MRTRRGMREARRLRSRRIRALLAGGLVLGVGAGMTLASWNDAEYSNAAFTAGYFGIVGNPGSGFSEHPSSPGAGLVFSIPSGSVSAMAPGNTAYAAFSVKTINPSVAGTVLLQADAGNGAGLGAFLKYRVRLIAGTTCDAAAFTAAGAAADVVSGAGSSDVALTSGAAASQVLAANGGGTVTYCFAVTLPAATDGTAQGAVLTAKWTFLATSS